MKVQFLTNQDEVWNKGNRISGFAKEIRKQRERKSLHDKETRKVENVSTQILKAVQIGVDNLVAVNNN